MIRERKRNEALNLLQRPGDSTENWTLDSQIARLFAPGFQRELLAIGY